MICMKRSMPTRTIQVINLLMKNAVLLGFSLILFGEPSTVVGLPKPSEEGINVNPEEPHRFIRSEELNSKDQVKDYSRWRLVRLFPQDARTTKSVINELDVLDSVKILNIRKRKLSYTEIELAISPDVSLEQVLGNVHHPPLCSLDNFIQNGGREKEIKNGDNKNKIQNGLRENEIQNGVSENKDLNGGSEDKIQNGRRENQFQPQTRDINQFHEELLMNVIFDTDASDCEGSQEQTGTNGHLKRDLNILKWHTIPPYFGYNSYPLQRQLPTSGNVMGWDSYHRQETILQFSRDLAKNNSNVGYIELGRSYENRPLFALVFATKPEIIVKKYHKHVSNAAQLLEEGGTRIQRRKRRKASILKETNKQLNILEEEQEQNGILNNMPKKRPKQTDEQDYQKSQPVRSPKKTKKPIVLIEAGIHAREWISPATATYLAQQLTKSGSAFLKHVTVIMVPLANPDGYEYSHTNDRMWRKNRRNSGAECFGVDLNRNWAISWGDPDGSSSASCSDQYCGPEAFSEQETIAIRDLTAVFLKKIKMFLSLHSFGQLLLNPWGHSDDRPPKNGKLKRMGRKFVNYLNKYTYDHFEGGQSSQVLYQSSGTSDDFMYQKGIPFSYTLELPNTYSFELHQSEILPIAEGVWDALKCFIGDIVGTKRARSFCNKRIVSVQNGNETATSWIKVSIPESRAKEIVLERDRQKKNKGSE